MKKKNLLTAMCVLSVSAMACAAPVMAAEEEAPAPQIVDAEVITYTTDEALSVAGVRIEYDQDITSGAYGPDSYYVNGYENTAVYVSASGEFKDAAKTGKYVFVEFQLSDVPGYYNGKVNFWTTDNTYTDMTLDVFCQADNCWFKTTDTIHFEAEDYIPGAVTGEGGVETRYQLYVPEGYETADANLEKLPLVIWLHGGGESGTDNYEQMVGNRGALNFSSKQAQAEHPCFVLAPQTDIGWEGDALVNINTMVLDLIANYNVDASRIYCSGPSMGGMGTRRLAQAYPTMLAAAVPIANNGFDDLGKGENLEDRTAYEGLPMVYVTAADDPVFSNGRNTIEGRTEEEATIEGQMQLAMDDFEALGMTVSSSIGDDALNGYLRGSLAAMEMKEALDAAAEKGADKIFVTYLSGTVVPAPHSSWMPATANTALHDWMFAQVNDAPYEG